MVQRVWTSKGMNFSQVHKYVTRHLNGFLPVYKPKGIHSIDLEELIKLSINFEFDWSLNSLAIPVVMYPRLRCHHEGLTNVAFGSIASRLTNIKHANTGAEVEAVFGERSDIFKRAFTNYQTQLGFNNDYEASHDSGYDTSNDSGYDSGLDTTREIEYEHDPSNDTKPMRDVSTITEEELGEVMSEFKGEFSQVRAPLEKIVR